MKTVRDDDGKRYVLLKRSGTASLVRDPDTGNECYVGNDRLEPVDDAAALETAARGVSEPVRRLLTTVHDERSLGLVLELADRGPLAARTILSTTDFCESDLHGRLATWVAAGLLEETTVHGERGYRATADCERAVSVLREDGAQGDDGGDGDGPTDDGSAADGDEPIDDAADGGSGDRRRDTGSGPTGPSG